MKAPVPEKRFLQMKRVLHEPHGGAWQWETKTSFSVAAVPPEKRSSSLLGSYKGPVNSNWEKIPLVFVFPTPYTVVKHLLYMSSLHSSCEGRNTEDAEKTEVEKSM